MGRVNVEPSLQLQLQKMQDDILQLQNAQRLMNLPVLTALPLNPYDGQVILFKATPDTTTKPGIIWTLRFNKNSPYTYQWDYISGPEIAAEIITAEAATNTTYTNLTTAGPSIINPLAGDYMVSVGANIEVNLASGWRGRMSPNALDANAAWASGGGSASIAIGGSTMKTTPLLTRTALQTTTATYRSDTGAAINFANRWMTMKPIRVG